MELKKTFLGGKMNKDLDQRLLSGGQYSDALNISIDTSEGSNIGSISNSLGNIKIGDVQALLSGYVPAINTLNSRVIGAIAYEPLNLIYWFISSDNYDAIFEYNEIDNTTTQVLLSTKTGGNPSQLNFSQEYLITGVNYIPGHKPESGALLFWTDNLNPPRKINIARTKQYSINDSRIDIDIDVILRPPLKAPVIYPSSSSDVLSNNMEDKFLYFAYRYKYVDNEYSSMSPYSGVAFKPSNYKIDPFTGDNKSMINTYNQCEIVFELGNSLVTEVQILAYDPRSLNVKIVKSIVKDDLIINGNINTSSYTFSNNKIYAPLPSDQVTRLFDNVPLLAQAQEIIGNRLIYGNYTQFRDVDSVNFNVTYTSVDALTPAGTPLSTFKTDRDYEVGIIYGDDYGRMTTALISDNNSVYIPSTVSDKGNSLKVQIQNTAPTWATNYRLVVKQAKKEYYNIFPLWFYEKDVYRYFRINEFDRDKFSVGQYVIFKSTAGGPTYSNTKYKILEFEFKSEGFDNIPGAESGLYFKIKVDNSEDFSYSELQSFSGEDESQQISSFNNINRPFPMEHKEISYMDLTHPYYGQNDSNSITVTEFTGPNNWTQFAKDIRVTVEIDGINPTTFKYTRNINGSSDWEAETQSIDGDIPLYYNAISVGSPQAGQMCTINFNQTSSYTVGDKWKVIFRHHSPQISRNYFQPGAGFPIDNYYHGGMPVNNTFFSTIDSEEISANIQYQGQVVLGFTDNPDQNVEVKIQPLSRITIEINSFGLSTGEGPGTGESNVQQFISDGTYDNVEEWFVESNAYLEFQHPSYPGSNDAESVCFRRAEYSPNYNSVIMATTVNYLSNIGEEETRLESPMRMLIRNYGNGIDGQGGRGIIASFKVEQSPNPLVCETDPKEEDVEIYHEVTDSYDIENGLHQVGWDYADFTHGVTVFPSLPTELQTKTILGPLNPAAPLTTDKPHNLSVGQYIYTAAGGTTNVPEINPDTENPYYVVLYVPNQYCVIVDYDFPGNAPAEPGIIYKQTWEQDQTATNLGAFIEINQTTAQNSQFNAFSFGNGVESNRIRDDFNASGMKFSPRVTSIIEDYENERKEASLTYSGVFRGDTSINRLNEFNLSLANFKDLDREFGAIEKLYARDTDVFVLHQDKINKVLYGKNVLFDSVGGGQVASIPEVLGNEIPFPVEYGISNNPESFAVNAGDMYFTDARRGAVIGIEKGSVNEISSLGMTDYFRDELKDNPSKQKLGGFDPYSNRYTLSTENNRRVEPCRLSLKPSSLTVESNTGGVSLFMFNILTSLSWSITLADTGFGTSWVSPSATSGYGAQNIYANIANNFTGSTRTINFVVTYCTSQTQVFTLTQSVGRPISVEVVVVNKPDRK